MLLARQHLERHPVAVDAVAGDHLDGVRRDDGRVPELLGPLVRVGDVHLDQRGAQLGAGVPEGERVLPARHRHQDRLLTSEHAPPTDGLEHVVPEEVDEVGPTEGGVVTP